MAIKEIIAEAGDAALTGRLLEIIFERAKALELTDYRSLATCVDDAAGDLWALLRKQQGCTPEELKAQLEKNPPEVLVAYYFKEKPYVFTLDLSNPYTRKRDELYVATGCGAPLADFLVSGLLGRTIQFGPWHLDRNICR